MFIFIPFVNLLELFENDHDWISSESALLSIGLEMTHFVFATEE